MPVGTARASRTGGDDAGGGARAPVFERAKPPSMRAAFVVLGCALVVSVGGFAVALIGSGQSTPTTVTGLATPVAGTGLSAVGAAGVLARIASGGTPPADILDSLVVPSGAHIVGTGTEDASVDQYDRSITFRLSSGTAALLSFYRIELRHFGWRLLGTYATSKQTTELLAQREGSDGYEWEVGAVVSSSNPSISPALAGDGQTSAEASLTLRLFQVPDTD